MAIYNGILLFHIITGKTAVNLDTVDVIYFCNLSLSKPSLVLTLITSTIPSMVDSLPYSSPADDGSIWSVFPNRICAAGRKRTQRNGLSYCDLTVMTHQKSSEFCDCLLTTSKWVSTFSSWDLAPTKHCKRKARSSSVRREGAWTRWTITEEFLPAGSV